LSTSGSTTGTKSGLWCPPVASSTSGVRWDDRALTVNLKTFDVKAQAMVAAAVAFHATRALNFARANAPWQDQTGNARNGLFAKTERDGSLYRMIIGHSVPYGIWLEVRWSGRYQIIRPTIDREGPELMRTVSLMYAKMSGGGLL
jgi:hypothetical protein